jgi:TetR/AcrR family transcriptional regulator, transcriptional repressor for nem operon
VAQAARDLDVHENVLRKWVKEFGSDPVQAFPGHGQMKPEQQEIERLRREVNKLKADRVRAALTFYAKSSYGVKGRRGCLVVGSAAELVTFDAEVAQRVTAALRRNEKLMADLIRQSQADGSIPATIDSETTGRLMMCLLQGMRVAGKIGRSRAEMSAVADAAMKLLD